MISGHLGTGVAFSGTATGNTVLGNEIYDNGALGIDLERMASPPTTRTMSIPARTTCRTSRSSLLADLNRYGPDARAGLSIPMESAPSTASSSSATRLGTEDATNGEARVYLGTITVTTDASGDASFSSVTLSGVTLSAGDYVTATATRIDDPGQVGVMICLRTGRRRSTRRTLRSRRNMCADGFAATSTTEGGLGMNADGGNDVYFRCR